MSNYVEKAYKIAVEAHAGQVDKAGENYIEHPKAVASFVDTDEERAVAYLHDVLEDSSVTACDLLDRGIPQNIVDAVKILTRRNDIHYDTYLQKVKENDLARNVKLADLRHNSDVRRLKTVTLEDEKRLAKYRTAIIFLIDK